AAAVAQLIKGRHVVSAHDCSDGGLLVAAVEMAMAGRLGVELDLAGLPTTGGMEDAVALFAETPGRYLLEVKADQLDAVVRQLRRRPEGGRPRPRPGPGCRNRYRAAPRGVDRSTRLVIIPCFQYPRPRSHDLGFFCFLHHTSRKVMTD